MWAPPWSEGATVVDAVPVNGAYRTRINNSTGSDTVTFSLVKRAGSVPISGPISGTGVLVMGVP